MMYDAAGVAKAPSSNVGLQRVPGYKKLDGVLIGRSELKKIESLAYASETHKKQVANAGERQDHLKTLSNDRIKNWPNTIDAMRLQGERRREDRLTRDELRKQVIDREEQELREVQKKQTLIDAEKKLFQTNDKVKAFNSHLQTYHTMLEREEQLHVKESLAKNRALRDEFLSRQEVETVERQAAADALRVKEKILLQNEVKQAQLQQVHEKKQQLLAERSESMLEQARLRQLAKDQEEADRIKLEQTKLKGKLLAKDREEQNARNIQLRKDEKENAARSTSQLDRNQFISTKGQHEQFLAERKQQRDVGKLQRIARSYDDLAAIRNAQEEALVSLERRRKEEGVLGMDDRMTSDDHSRLLKSKSDQRAAGEAGFYHPNERALKNTRLDALKEKHRLESIRRNFEMELEEEIADREEKKREAKRHQRILLLQQKEKEAQRIMERLGEFEERKEMELATMKLNEEASQYINQSLRTLSIKPSASKYLTTTTTSGDTSGSPIQSMSSPTKRRSQDGRGEENQLAQSAPTPYYQQQLQEHLHPSMYKSMNLSTMENPALPNTGNHDNHGPTVASSYDSDGSPQKDLMRPQNSNRTTSLVSEPPRRTDLKTSALLHLQKHSKNVTTK